jgi:hypothetical protein
VTDGTIERQPPETVDAKEYQRAVRTLIEQKLNTFGGFSYVADAAWVVGFVRKVVKEWCETNEHDYSERPLQHVAPSREGLAPKFLMTILTRRLPPPPVVYYHLEDMPEAVSPPDLNTTYTVETMSVDTDDSGNYHVYLKYKGEGENN